MKCLKKYIKKSLYLQNIDMVRVSWARENVIAGRQRYRCNNKPNSNLKGLGTFECPMWKINENNKGSFDASGFKIDYIDEDNLDKSNSNLQALCNYCSSIKRKKVFK